MKGYVFPYLRQCLCKLYLTTINNKKNVKKSITISLNLKPYAGCVLQVTFLGNVAAGPVNFFRTMVLSSTLWVGEASPKTQYFLHKCNWISASLPLNSGMMNGRGVVLIVVERRGVIVDFGGLISPSWYMYSYPNLDGVAFVRIDRGPNLFLIDFTQHKNTSHKNRTRASWMARGNHRRKNGNGMEERLVEANKAS